MDAPAASAELELLRRRRWAHATMPVIVYTTSDLPADRRRCEAAGVRDYLVKTEPVETVLALVHDRVRVAG